MAHVLQKRSKIVRYLVDNDYFDAQNYNGDKYWHIGYYKNGLDIECIGFERISNQTWDLFFDDSSDPGLVDDNHPRIDIFGAFLFNVPEEEAEQRFHSWVENVLLPFRSSDR